MVWLAVIVVMAAGSLVAAWWSERSTAPDLDVAPAEPSVFCNTVGELHARGAITVAMGEGAAGLQSVSDGLGRLAAAGPPAAIRDDLVSLQQALDPVIRAALVATPGDSGTVGELLVLLDDQTRDLQPASDRVNAYTKRWCGVDLNGTAEPDEGPAASVPSADVSPSVTPG